MIPEVLRELVELTPLPPATMDVDELLRAFSEMVDARQHWIDQHPRDPNAPASPPETRALLREISDREEVWQRALVAARAAVGLSRHNTTLLRAYNR